MAKWFITIIFIIIFSFAAYAQDDAKIMETWVQQNFGIQVPHVEISQSWNSVPMINGCDYEWSVRWKDAKFQIKDQNDNYYRVYYQGETLTLDFKRDFNWIFIG